ncbi:DEAD/DEAH box helicase family protein [candidate division WOR-3 bacterium]|nr:DEAD/DEAH box helicase family protein [candidate division WOR-3 bacterium]
MARGVIDYDRDLPEIAGRRPWEKPTQHLVKDARADSGWRVADKRRESLLLLVPKIRKAVDAWRGDDNEWSDDNYAGASEVAKTLFRYWFYEDHDVPSIGAPFRYWFCQREAIETLVWLVEIAGNRDGRDLVKRYATKHKMGMLPGTFEFQTTTDGRRQVRRYVPELERDVTQDLPPEDLRRYAFKMATGSGKTWVMAMALVWSYFHRRMEPESDLSTNFLVVAPNVIVYQRLEKDFASNRIFYELPLVPPEWGKFAPKVILRGDAAEPDPSGNLFLTNIQQLYESRETEWTPLNAVEAILGRKPASDPASANQRSMLARLQSLRDLVVINDEAHHVHDEDLAWSQSLLAIHRALPAGLGLWLDFSATPRVGGSGPFYPWTVCDYPLAQAVEDRIVKAPIIVSKQDDLKQPKKDPEKVNRRNVAEKYGFWLQAAVARWKDHARVYKKLGLRPVLFVMAEKNAYADALGEFLWKSREFGFKESEVLVIHTDTKGEITKKDLDSARQVARDIDRPDNKVKVIVSVMMLREGWDVKGVSVVLGLRAYESDILAEQVIGRGLRLMSGVSPDRTQTLEVLGTRNLLQVLRDQLEADGVGVTTTTKDPPKPVIIEPVLERKRYDIAIPITKPRLEHDILKLSELNISRLEPIYERGELVDVYRLRLKQEFAVPQVEVGQVVVDGDVPPSHEVLASIAAKTAENAKLTGRFAELYPLVRDYVARRCFGRKVDIEAKEIRSHLGNLLVREGIAKYLAKAIGNLTVVRREVEFDRADHRLSQTRPFRWQRNLPLLEAKHTIFNLVATYNKYERGFAEFLDRAKDVTRFASLGTTEQGDSGTQFRVDYLKPSGAIGFYYPDWVVVQKVGDSEVNWIIETKGRVWEGTEAKDASITDWCERVSALTGFDWRFVRVNQPIFESQSWKTLAALVDSIKGGLSG